MHMPVATQHAAACLRLVFTDVIDRQPLRASSVRLETPSHPTGQAQHHRPALPRPSPKAEPRLHSCDPKCSAPRSCNLCCMHIGGNKCPELPTPPLRTQCRVPTHLIHDAVMTPHPMLAICRHTALCTCRPSRSMQGNQRSSSRTPNSDASSKKGCSCVGRPQLLRLAELPRDQVVSLPRAPRAVPGKT